MNKGTLTPIQFMELQEVIQKLKDAGYADLVDCFLENEKDCFTKKGRLNKSSTCRKLEIKGKALEDAFKEMQQILKNEYDYDAED